jgi:hypothetical protein
VLPTIVIQLPTLDVPTIAVPTIAIQLPTAAPTAAPPPTAAAGRLAVRLLNYNDEQTCISMKINGIRTAGWSFTVDGLRLRGTFDASGNARLCGLAPGQEVTISVRNRAGDVVLGGGGVPAKGSAILEGNWQR